MHAREAAVCPVVKGGEGWHRSCLALSDAWPPTESQVSTGSTREVAVTPAVSTTTGLCSINSAPPPSNTRRADAELPRAAPLPHGRPWAASWRGGREAAHRGTGRGDSGRSAQVCSILAPVARHAHKRGRETEARVQEARVQKGGGGRGGRRGLRVRPLRCMRPPPPSVACGLCGLTLSASPCAATRVTSVRLACGTSTRPRTSSSAP